MQQFEVSILWLRALTSVLFYWLSSLFWILSSSLPHESHTSDVTAHWAFHKHLCPLSCSWEPFSACINACTTVQIAQYISLSECVHRTKSQPIDNGSMPMVHDQERRLQSWLLSYIPIFVQIIYVILITLSSLHQISNYECNVKSCTIISAMRRLDLMAPKRQSGWSVTRSLKAAVPLVSGFGKLNCIIKTTVNWDFSHFSSLQKRQVFDNFIFYCTLDVVTVQWTPAWFSLCSAQSVKFSLTVYGSTYVERTLVHTGFSLQPEKIPCRNNRDK